MVALLMVIAFLPVAALAGTRIFPTLKPRRHSPLAFVSGGFLMLFFGVMIGFPLRSYLQSGVVHFPSRHFGEIHAASAEEPLAYWAVMLLLYAIAVFLAGFGLASFGLCFRERLGQ